LANFLAPAFGAQGARQALETATPGKHIRLTQQELADLVGATRPVVSTILNRLRKQSVLEYSHEYLCVRSIETVEQLIGE